MDEPSVLDFILDKLAFWRESTLTIPPEEEQEKSAGLKAITDQLTLPGWKKFLVFLPALFAVIAQLFCEPENRSTTLAIFFYIAAVVSFVLLVLFRD